MGCHGKKSCRCFNNIRLIFNMIANKITCLKRACTKTMFWMRYKRPCSRARLILTVFCASILSLMTVLHFVLLPKFTGAYNDECYLDEKKLNELRHLVLVSAKLMEKYNMTYWLDYGTLLGAVKFGDVLPWDGDADISSLYEETFDPSTMNDEFREHGIARNSLVATVNGTRMDYLRWTISKGIFSGNEEMLINKYYPEWIMKNENVFVKLQHSVESLPLSWIVPTRKLNFLGVPLPVPGEYEKVLSARYPLTYRFNIFTPYKWKCWLPCWLTRTKDCRKYSKPS